MIPFAPPATVRAGLAVHVPYRRHTRPIALVLAALLVAAGSFVVGAVLPTRSSPGDPGGAGSRPAAGLGAHLATPDGPASTSDLDLARLDRAIGVWTANLRDDPADFISADDLALDEYARGRLTGAIDDYVRAREATDLALAAYPADVTAKSMDAVLLATLHDFAGALRVASAIYASDRGQLQALATMGDAQLELGSYAAAAASYTALESRAPSAAVTARLAHLAQLEGRTADATRLAARAVTEAVAEGATGPSLAWYEVLAGSIAFQAGDLSAAASAYGAGLQEWPDSYTALAGLARTRAAEGRFADAIVLDKRAIAIVPLPDTLAALGDLYQLTGRASLARQQYDIVRAIATLGAVQRQVYDRQLALFDADHGVHLAEALRLARTELAVRHDVYGWDAEAWALLANGQPGAADAAMRHALAQGTRDALLDYHAGMIAAALGQEARARTFLTESLALNPGFSPLQAVRARQALQGLP